MRAMLHRENHRAHAALQQRIKRSPRNHRSGLRPRRPESAPAFAFVQPDSGHHVSRDLAPTYATSRCARDRCTSSSETAAGVTPGMRLAWPTVCGRTRSNFCRTSADSPRTAA